MKKISISAHELLNLLKASKGASTSPVVLPLSDTGLFVRATTTTDDCIRGMVYSKNPNTSNIYTSVRVMVDTRAPYGEFYGFRKLANLALIECKVILTCRSGANKFSASPYQRLLGLIGFIIGSQAHTPKVVA